MISKMMEGSDVQLNEANFSQICRLCLQEDNEFSISAFDRTDPNKRPLVERIFDLFQVQVSVIGPIVLFLPFAERNLIKPNIILGFR